MSQRITVDGKALRQVLEALIGPGHFIRELQALRSPEELFPDNPINVLIKEYNQQVGE